MFLLTRWDVVAQYLSQHGPNKTTRPSKEVLSKAKELQNTDSAQLKEAANKAAVSSMAAEAIKPANNEAEASKRLESECSPLSFTLCIYLINLTLKIGTTEKWSCVICLSLGINHVIKFRF